MSLVIYEHPLSPYAQKVKIALDEKGVPYEAKMPNAIGSGQPDLEFLKANPRGEVPALIDGDVSIFDSTIILEYIEDKWPAPPMLPKSPAARATARTIEEVMDTLFEPINWGMGEIRWFRRAEGEPSRRAAPMPGWNATWATSPGSTARRSAGPICRWCPTSTARWAQAWGRTRAAS
jgi:glutathione S-transferase/RNA polymerase-associated protein